MSRNTDLYLLGGFLTACAVMLAGVTWGPALINATLGG